MARIKKFKSKHLNVISKDYNIGKIYHSKTKNIKLWCQNLLKFCLLIDFKQFWVPFYWIIF